MLSRGPPLPLHAVSRHCSCRGCSEWWTGRKPDTRRNAPTFHANWRPIITLLSRKSRVQVVFSPLPVFSICVRVIPVRVAGWSLLRSTSLLAVAKAITRNHAVLHTHTVRRKFHTVSNGFRTDICGTRTDTATPKSGPRAFRHHATPRRPGAQH